MKTYQLFFYTLLFSLFVQLKSKAIWHRFQLPVRRLRQVFHSCKENHFRQQKIGRKNLSGLPDEAAEGRRHLVQQNDGVGSGLQSAVENLRQLCRCTCRRQLQKLRLSRHLPTSFGWSRSPTGDSCESTATRNSAGFLNRFGLKVRKFCRFSSVANTGFAQNDMTRTFCVSIFRGLTGWLSIILVGKLQILTSSR